MVDPLAPTPLVYKRYTDESELSAIMALIAQDLSEPYSIYTYRYFLHSWPSLCILVCSIWIYSLVGVKSDSFSEYGCRPMQRTCVWG